MKKIILAAILLSSCYSPQMLTPDETRETQVDAVRAARDLEQLPDTGHRPAILDAARALQNCAAELRAQGHKLNAVVKAANQCKAEFDVQSEELAKYKQEAGPIAWLTDKLGRFGNAVFWFVMGGVFGGLAFRLLQFLLARVPV